MGVLYVVVVMARGNPGDCCGLDDDVGGSIRRVNLRGGYGLVYASDNDAAGYTIVVGGLSGDLIRPNQRSKEKSLRLTVPALFLPTVSENVITRLLDVFVFLSPLQGRKSSLLVGGGHSPPTLLPPPVVASPILKAKFLRALYASIRDPDKQTAQNYVCRLYRPNTGADRGCEGSSGRLASA